MGTLLVYDKVYPIFKGLNRIGRDIDATVVLTHGSVSQFHAIITVVNDDLHFVSELKSTNGTFLNGKTPEHKIVPLNLYNLEDGDKIYFAKIPATYKRTVMDSSSQIVNNSQITNKTVFGMCTQVMEDSQIFKVPHNVSNTVDAQEAETQRLPILEEVSEQQRVDNDDIPTQCFPNMPTEDEIETQYLPIAPDETNEPFSNIISDIPTQCFANIPEEDLSTQCLPIIAEDDLETEPLPILSDDTNEPLAQERKQNSEDYIPTQCFPDMPEEDELPTQNLPIIAETETQILPVEPEQENNNLPKSLKQTHLNEHNDSMEYDTANDKNKSVNISDFIDDSVLEVGNEKEPACSTSKITEDKDENNVPQQNIFQTNEDELNEIIENCELMESISEPSTFNTQNCLQKLKEDEQRNKSVCDKENENSADESQLFKKHKVLPIPESQSTSSNNTQKTNLDDESQLIRKTKLMPIPETQTSSLPKEDVTIIHDSESETDDEINERSQIEDPDSPVKNNENEKATVDEPDFVETEDLDMIPATQDIDIEITSSINNAKEVSSVKKHQQEQESEDKINDLTEQSIVESLELHVSEVNNSDIFKMENSWEDSVLSVRADEIESFLEMHHNMSVNEDIDILLSHDFLKRNCDVPEDDIRNEDDQSKADASVIDECINKNSENIDRDNNDEMIYETEQISQDLLNLNSCENRNNSLNIMEEKNKEEAEKLREGSVTPDLPMEENAINDCNNQGESAKLNADKEQLEHEKLREGSITPDLNEEDEVVKQVTTNAVNNSKPIESNLRESSVTPDLPDVEINQNVHQEKNEGSTNTSLDLLQYADNDENTHTEGLDELKSTSTTPDLLNPEAEMLLSENNAKALNEVKKKLEEIRSTSTTPDHLEPEEKDNKLIKSDEAQNIKNNNLSKVKELEQIRSTSTTPDLLNHEIEEDNILNGNKNHELLRKTQELEDVRSNNSSPDLLESYHVQTETDFNKETEKIQLPNTEKVPNIDFNAETEKVNLVEISTTVDFNAETECIRREEDSNVSNKNVDFNAETENVNLVQISTTVDFNAETEYIRREEDSNVSNKNVDFNAETENVNLVQISTAVDFNAETECIRHEGDLNVSNKSEDLMSSTQKILEEGNEEIFGIATQKMTDTSVNAAENASFMGPTQKLESLFNDSNRSENLLQEPTQVYDISVLKDSSTTNVFIQPTQKMTDDNNTSIQPEEPSFMGPTQKLDALFNDSSKQNDDEPTEIIDVSLLKEMALKKNDDCASKEIVNDNNTSIEPEKPSFMGPTQKLEALFNDSAKQNNDEPTEIIDVSVLKEMASKNNDNDVNKEIVDTSNGPSSITQNMEAMFADVTNKPSDQLFDETTQILDKTNQVAGISTSNEVKTPSASKLNKNNIKSVEKNLFEKSTQKIDETIIPPENNRPMNDDSLFDMETPLIVTKFQEPHSKEKRSSTAKNLFNTSCPADLDDSSFFIAATQEITPTKLMKQPSFQESKRLPSEKESEIESQLEVMFASQTPKIDFNSTNRPGNPLVDVFQSASPDSQLTEKITLDKKIAESDCNIVEKIMLDEKSDVHFTPLSKSHVESPEESSSSSKDVIENKKESPSTPIIYENKLMEQQKSSETKRRLMSLKNKKIEKIDDNVEMLNITPMLNECSQSDNSDETIINKEKEIISRKLNFEDFIGSNKSIEDEIDESNEIKKTINKPAKKSKRKQSTIEDNLDVDDEKIIKSISKRITRKASVDTDFAEECSSKTPSSKKSMKKQSFTLNNDESDETKNKPIIKRKVTRKQSVDALNAESQVNEENNDCKSIKTPRRRKKPSLDVAPKAENSSTIETVNNVDIVKKKSTHSKSNTDKNSNNEVKSQQSTNLSVIEEAAEQSKEKSMETKSNSDNLPVNEEANTSTPIKKPINKRKMPQKKKSKKVVPDVVVSEESSIDAGKSEEPSFSNLDMKSVTDSLLKEREMELGISSQENCVTSEDNQTTCDELVTEEKSKRKGRPRKAANKPESKPALPENDNSQEELSQERPKRGTKRKSSEVNYSEYLEVPKKDKPIKKSARNKKVQQQEKDVENKTTNVENVKEEVEKQGKSSNTRTKKGSKSVKTSSETNDNISVVTVTSSEGTINEVKPPSSRNKRSSNSQNEDEVNAKRMKSDVLTSPSPEKNLNNISLIATPSKLKRGSQFKIVFTLLDNPELSNIVKGLGGSVVSSVDTCTVLVTGNLKRTQKLLMAIAMGKPICSPDFLIQSKEAKQFLDPWDFILEDPDAETRCKFSLKEALTRSQTQKIFEGYNVLISCTNLADTLQSVVKVCGGKIVSRAPAQKGNVDKFVVVGDANESNKYEKYLKKRPPLMVVSSEAILDGVLRQELHFDKHLLK